MGILEDATFIITVTTSHMQGSDSQLFASCVASVILSKAFSPTRVETKLVYFYN